MEQNTASTTDVVINEWDTLVIHIAKGEGENSESGAIKMMKQDIDAMMNLHGVDRGYILEMMLSALETTPKQENSDEDQS